MNPELVSIITPCYNAAPYLSAMLESVQAQTWGHYEHLIIDDCSTDDSLNIVRRYQSKDPRIRLITQENNRGPACARNRGIREAKGDFIALLDADDIWLPEKLQMQMSIFQRYPEIDVVDADRYVIDAEGKLIAERAGNVRSCWGKVNVADFVLDRIPLTMSSAVLRKKCFEISGLFNENYLNCTDFDLWLRVLQNCQLAILNEKLFCYRSHSGGISKNTLKSKIGKIKILENELLPRLELLGERREEFLLMMQKRYVSLGRLLMKNNRHHEAVAYLEKAQKIEGGNPLTVFKTRLYLLINKVFF